MPAYAYIQGDCHETLPTCSCPEGRACRRRCSRCLDVSVAADRGITDSEVVVGMSSALSGPNAGYGVIGRAVEPALITSMRSTVASNLAMARPARSELRFWMMLWSRRVPCRTRRRLVSQAGVFVVSGNVGTGANLGARQFYNSEGVPQVFIGSGGPDVRRQGRGCEVSLVDARLAVLQHRGGDVRGVHQGQVSRTPRSHCSTTIAGGRSSPTPS